MYIRRMLSMEATDLPTYLFGGAREGGKSRRGYLGDRVSYIHPNHAVASPPDLGSLQKKKKKKDFFLRRRDLHNPYMHICMKRNSTRFNGNQRA